MKILIVDDEQDLCEILQYNLEAEGYEVQTAASAEEAKHGLRITLGQQRMPFSIDSQRHRLTAGLTFTVRNKFFPTDIRLNYEKYWYPHAGTPKESEQDKLVAELMIRF